MDSLHTYHVTYKGHAYTWQTDTEIPMEGMITMKYKTDTERMTECHNWLLANGEKICSDRYCDVNHLCPLNDYEFRDLAKRLALALADECAFAGADAAERSLELLQEATDKLNLHKEMEEVDTLSA